MPVTNSNNQYNKSLRVRANSLRKDMTKSEACLWKYVLSNKQMQGYTFRRQRPVMDYIADFMCKELMLIIEVDGITHDNAQSEKYDEVRQKNLERIGFTVLRFSARDVLNSIEFVRMAIEDWIDCREKC